MVKRLLVKRRKEILSNLTQEIPANGIITVLPMSAHGVRVEICQVEGWRKDNAFFDHDVIYKFYQRIIDDYQRYDANQQ